MCQEAQESYLELPIINHPLPPLPPPKNTRAEISNTMLQSMPIAYSNKLLPKDDEMRRERHKCHPRKDGPRMTIRGDKK